jgi:hypothetical protein
MKMNEQQQTLAKLKKKGKMTSKKGNGIPACTLFGHPKAE